MHTHLLRAKHCSKCLQTIQFLVYPLQPPHDVGDVTDSFTDEEFEVRRGSSILMKVVDLGGEFESKSRKLTYLNTTKLH